MDPAPTTSTRRSRPCDVCRKRKRRCLTRLGDSVCQLCRANGLSECTFIEPEVATALQKRLAEDEPQLPSAKRQDASIDHTVRTANVIEDYDSLRGLSLLKRNLGLQQHRYLRYAGPLDELDVRLFEYCSFNDRDEHRLPNGASVRKVAADTQFVLTPYAGSKVREEEFEQLDAIERFVSPNGSLLVKLYFEYVHASFPILDKQTFLEKYERTYREFSPPCLAGIYILAWHWWNYDRELSSQPKPDVMALERLARLSLQNVIHCPKLSTLQGGLLILQHRPTGEGSWATSCQMVAIAQELGVHLNCDAWRIPQWEKSLRRRLGRSIYVLDKWMALSHGRPSHILDDEWAHEVLEDDDLPEVVNSASCPPQGPLPFKHLITLTAIMSRILKLFYSPRAREQSLSDPHPLLEAAKPVQIELKAWHQHLSDALSRGNGGEAPFDVQPSLHLLYFATEIALHRAIQTSLARSPCDSFIIDVCRSAARERVTGAIRLVKSLGVRQLRSFWYFPTGKALVSVGTFCALLYVTSRSIGEAETYKGLIDEYRWALRTMSGSLDHVEYAVQRLDASLWHFEHITTQDVTRGLTSASPDRQEGVSVPGDTTNSNSNGGDQQIVNGEAAQEAIGIETRNIDAIPLSPGDSAAAGAVPSNGDDALGQYVNWVDITFPPFAISNSMPLTAGVPSHDAALLQQQSVDFFGRDWLPPSETSEFWDLNRSLEEH